MAELKTRENGGADAARDVAACDVASFLNTVDVAKHANSFAMS